MGFIDKSCNRCGSSAILFYHGHCESCWDQVEIEIFREKQKVIDGYKKAAEEYRLSKEKHAD